MHHSIYKRIYYKALFDFFGNRPRTAYSTIWATSNNFKLLNLYKLCGSCSGIVQCIHWKMCDRLYTRSSQSIKIGIELSIDKSMKIGKSDMSDLIGIDCIHQSVEIDDTLVSFIDLSRFLPISSIHIARNICSSKN